MVDQPEEMSERDLVVAGAVAKDKPANAERRGKEGRGPGDHASALEQVAAQLAESGAELEPMITAREPERDEVDIAER